MPINKNREYRAFSQFDLDSAGDNNKNLIIRGTPVVFNTPALMLEYEGTKYYEKIDRHALDEADTSDFIFNYNHSGRVYARTKNGTLTFRSDDLGFHCEMTLSSEDEGHLQLYRDIKSGLIDKMSFAFSVREASFDKETHTRTIFKVKKLYDVSAVDFPAYEDTSISARNSFSEEFLKEFGNNVSDLKRRREMLIAETYFIF